MEWPGNDHKTSPDIGQPPTSFRQSEQASKLPELPPHLRERLRFGRSSASEQSLPKLLSQAASTDWSIRAQAIQKLGSLGSQAPLDVLVHALHDENEAVRVAATRSVGKLRDHAPLGHLLPGLHDTSWQVRSATAQALGKLGKRVPLHVLIGVFNDEDESVRAAATGALGEIGDPAAIRLLLLALSDPSWHVREMAVFALGKFGTQVPAIYLVPLLQDKDAQVREAVESLNETQPELFKAIYDARRIQSTQYSQGGTFQHSHQITMQQVTSTDTPSLRTQVIHLLQQGFLYGWCVQLGYLMGCGWYMSQQPRPAQSSWILTFLHIITMTGQPLGTAIPIGLRIPLLLFFLVLFLGGIWAMGNYLHERKQQKKLQGSPKASLMQTPTQKRTVIQQTLQTNEHPLTNRIVSPPISRRVAITGLASLLLMSNGVAWSLILRRSGTLAQNTAMASSQPGTPLYAISIQGGAMALAWSPDSTSIASGGQDAVVQIRTITTGQILQTYKGHEQLITAVAWSPDGKYIASGSTDSTIHVWEAATGQKKTVYRAHTDTIVDLSWSLDSTRIVSSAQDSTVQIWQAATGKTLARIEGTNGDIANVAWSPNNLYIAIIGLNQQLSVINGMTFKPIFTKLADIVNGTFLSSIGHGIVWSPDSLSLAYNNRAGQVHMLNINTGQLVMTYQTSSVALSTKQCSTAVSTACNIASSVAWSPNGKQIATANQNKKVQVWDIATGQTLFNCSGSSIYFFTVAWSPDGSYLAATSSDNPALQIWKAF